MAATTARSTSPSPTPTPSLLHNTSFTLTRLSPLYSLSPSRLSHYAHEFRDIVKGDILRGVRTTALPERPSASKSTLVRSCEWTLEADVLQGESFESLVVRVTWDDGGVFTAILVPDFTVPGTATATSLGKRKRVNTASGEAGSAGAGGFTSLPLMLSRGAPVVREQLINYLTTRFDCRASEVGLPSSLLQECLQGYLERCFTAADDDNDVSPRAIEKKIRVLEVMFTIPEVKTSKVKNALRKITISLPAQDVHELYRRSPTVMEALGKHVRASTAITLDALSVSRIACAGVILDAGGKMKVFEGAGSEGTRFILGKVVGFVARDGLPV